MKDQKVSILIPTFNAGEKWPELLQALDQQEMHFHRKIIVDSGSRDHTVKLAEQFGFEVIKIASSDFNHGATRQLLVDLAGDSDVCVFLTQDAIPATNNSLPQLCQIFINPDIAVAYGRQLPHKGADVLETHARLFNYPEQSAIRSFEERKLYGFKVFFCSNSFAAYRKAALLEIGGFPSDSIMGEDAIATAKLLLKGYKVAYVAEATVYHSHSYPFLAEFRRYFDTRIFHEQNQWLIDQFGKPTGEGLKYVKSEIKFVFKRKPILLFNVFTSLAGKWLGYYWGGFYKNTPKFLLQRFSMHKAFWN